MTEQEAFSIIRNVIRLEGVAKEMARLSTKELSAVIKRVKAIIEGMPDGSVERELAYKQIEKVLRVDILQAPAVQLSADVQQRLPLEAEYQAEWGAKYIDVRPGEINDLQAAALKGVNDTRVLSKGVGDMFVPLSNAQFRRIDKIVRAGFLGGLTNQQIAQEIGQTIKASKAELRAMSRTAVMSMAQETHNAIWDANADVIEKWVFDASMDYRVCPECAPLDGRTKERRSDLPNTPIHPNCRCMVLPDTGIDTDTGGRSYVELVKDKPQEGPGVRVYKQKVRGKDGKMYWKVARDTKQPITMAGFLRRANNITQEEVLGKGRAKRFRQLIKGTPGSRAPLSPEEALIKVTK